MEPEPGLRVSLERVNIEWATEKPTLYSARQSPDFAVGAIRCRLELCCSYGDKYALFLRADGGSPSFRVTTYLAKGPDLFLSETEAVEDSGQHCVWICKKSQILKAVPDFQQRRMCSFKVVFDIAHDGKAHPAEAPRRTTSTSAATRFGLDSLRSDLENLLVSDSSTDVELKCGPRTFRAHGCLLSARSDVFRAMLGSDMLEGQSGRVEVRDTEPEVLELFLRYLYTAQLPELTTATAGQLYEMADQYNVQALKVRCGCFLTENLSPGSASEVLALADRHSDSDLKESTLAYMLDRNVSLSEDA